MRRIFRWFALALVGLVLLVAAGTLVPRPLFASADAGQKTRQILLLSNPIHTDIAVLLDDELRRRFGFLGDAGLPLEAPGARYLVFGWGGRTFYLETPTWAEAKAGPVLKGLTLDRSAMHVTLTGAIAPDADFATSLAISEQGYQRLLNRIDTSFTRASGQPMLIEGAGYGQHDRFYEAEGRFTALLGCNTWTAQVLRDAGLRTGSWNPLPVLLRASVAMFNG